jgi:hypothetical protein
MPYVALALVVRVVTSRSGSSRWMAPGLEGIGGRHECQVETPADRGVSLIEVLIQGLRTGGHPPDGH